MYKEKNLQLTGAGGKPILLDIFYQQNPPQPVVIYAHGFNGFKDWGAFDRIAEDFVAKGFCFLKFNFSHGGTSPTEPSVFVDLEAYGNNNYTKELYDLQCVINWTADPQNPYRTVMDGKTIFLIGHSKGGGVVLLKAAEEQRVKGVATWASVSQSKTPWGNWPEDRMQKWKENGVEYYTNTRTGQQMPLYYQLYQDYQQNAERLNILVACSRLTIPLLLCHGTQDEAVPLANAYQLQQAAPKAELFLVESDHVFGRKHPWTSPAMPEKMQAVVDKTIEFFRSILMMA